MLPQQQRRRRRRAALSRTAERRIVVARGAGGFGFTIAGQRPCVVSAVAAGGPAERAGLRAGDALLAVDGANVARAPHASVARLVAAAPGAIALSVSPREAPPTDTEDTEPDERARTRRRHPPPRRRLQAAHHPGCHAVPSSSGVNEILQNLSRAQLAPNNVARLECRAVVGYLGTIETPQASPNAAPGNVKTAVRKLRQERRPATPVLLSVLPNSLLLRRPNGQVLAQYQRERIVYAGCGSDADRRYFGLVTSAETAETEASHSCHVFGVDPRMAEHDAHLTRAQEFQIACSRDPVAERCLEFPPSAEYVIGVIRGMYSLPAEDCSSPSLQQISKLAIKGDSPAMGNFSRCNRPVFRVPRDRPRRQDERVDPQDFVANSPQPSNHSEITTTSSNSDSGIGFYNDGRNIADRILVVDFGQQPPPNRYRQEMPRRPAGLVGCSSFDTDSSFLSNTTPVVDGFGGQGRPLNLDDVILTKDLQSVRHVSPRKEDDSYNYNNIYSNMPSTSRYENGVVYDQVHTENEGHYQFIPPQLDMDFEIDRVVETFNSVEIYEERPRQPLENIWHSNESVPRQPPDWHSNESVPRQPPDWQSNESVPRQPPDWQLNESVPRQPPDWQSNESIPRQPPDWHSNESVPRQPPDWQSNESASRQQNDWHSNESESQQGFDWHSNESVSRQPPDWHSNESVSRQPYNWHSNESVENVTVISGGTGTSKASMDSVSVYSSRSHEEARPSRRRHMQASLDDMLVLGLRDPPPVRDKNDSNFVHPSSVKYKVRKSIKPLNILSKTKQMLSSKDKEKQKEERRRALSASAGDVCEERQEALCTAASEPDLRDTQSEQSSPFRRWTTGSGAGSSYRHHDHRNMYNKQMSEGSTPTTTGGSSNVARWALGLEHLLADPAGAAAFAHFLTKEFAVENINFWWSCEQYNTTPDPERRATLAQTIWSRHLCETAPEPVNVDAAARRAAALLLDTTPPPPDMFQQAQKQIFNVMKFDSYPRFLRSAEHAECARADLRGLPPPYAPTDCDRAESPKLKKSGSNASERRRSGGTSLLPWKIRTGRERSNSTQHNEPPNIDVVKSSQSVPGQCSLCRVVLPDGATSVVGVDDSVTVGRLVDRLLQRRNLLCTTYDVLLKDNNQKPQVVELSSPSTILGGREACVERRVVVRVSVGRRAVAVRCRGARTLRHVVQPLLRRYAHGAALTARTLDGTVLHPDTLMQDLDGTRIIVSEGGSEAERVADDDTDSLSDLAVRIQPDDEQATSTSEGRARVRAALRNGAALHHHPPDFLENLRETQRQRLQPAAAPRTPPPLPPKPPRAPPAAV